MSIRLVFFNFHGLLDLQINYDGLFMVLLVLYEGMNFVFYSCLELVIHYGGLVLEVIYIGLALLFLVHCQVLFVIYTLRPLQSSLSTRQPQITGHLKKLTVNKESLNTRGKI